MTGTRRPPQEEASQRGAARALDGGSASIVVLASGLALLLLALGLCAVGAAVAVRHRAQSAADLAALAGAGRIGSTEDPCTAASAVAALNGAEMISCSLNLAPSGRSGRVDVRVQAEARILGAAPVAAARASAERLPA